MNGSSPLHPDDVLLQEALRRAVRRFPPPAMPTDLDAALQVGPAAVVAFCVAKADRPFGLLPAVVLVESVERWRRPFTAALAELLARAVEADPVDGDAGWQARVLAAGSPDVKHFLEAVALRDREAAAVRPLVDAVAHPGKLDRLPEGDLREGLVRLHLRGRVGDLEGMAREVEALLAGPAADDPRLVRDLRRLLEDPALSAPPADARALDASADVLRYQALRRRAMAAARGTPSAAARGALASGRGAATEAAMCQAFERVARLLADKETASRGARAAYRVVHRLRVPAGFPGEAKHLKSEWDVALLRAGTTDAGDELVLLAEAKASPEAGGPDLYRLLGGLRRLAQAPDARPIEFSSAEGDVALDARSLSGLAPEGASLPWRVFYGCDAPAEAASPLLSPSARGLLMAHPICLRFAWGLMQGATPSPDELQPLWIELVSQHRLHQVRRQDHMTRVARAAMLHPDDLVAAVEAVVQAIPGASS